jgi:hypothetical protein
MIARLTLAAFLRARLLAAADAAFTYDRGGRPTKIDYGSARSVVDTYGGA